MSEKPTRAGARPLVLVVDDEESVRGVLTYTLQRLGCEVLGAAGGAEALGLYRGRGGEIAAVLLDLRMPGGPGGLEVLAGLRRADPAVRCCLMSGDSGECTAPELEVLSGCPILGKPFRLEEVRAALNLLLEPAT